MVIEALLQLLSEEVEGGRELQLESCDVVADWIEVTVADAG